MGVLCVRVCVCVWGGAGQNTVPTNWLTSIHDNKIIAVLAMFFVAWTLHVRNALIRTSTMLCKLQRVCGRNCRVYPGMFLTFPINVCATFPRHMLVAHAFVLGGDGMRMCGRKEMTHCMVPVS